MPTIAFALLLSLLGPAAPPPHVQIDIVFTGERIRAGRIDPGRVLNTLAEAGAQDVLLVLEVIPPFEQDDAGALADLRASAELWQAALTQRGAR